MSDDMRESEQKRDFPALEMICPKCQGKSGLVDGKWVECYKCDRTGEVLTEFGRAVLLLVGRHLKHAEIEIGRE